MGDVLASQSIFLNLVIAAIDREYALTMDSQARGDPQLKLLIPM